MNDFMPNPEQHGEPYPIGKLTLAYVIALEYTIAGFLVIGFGFFLFYVLIGILLTRYISRRVLWHVFQVSLGEVAVTKMRLWFLWVIAVPVLLVQIVIAEKL